ncbi:MAG: type II toxin-antitoxin system VapC family toxin [Pirellulaceae bacterium]
MPSVYLETTIPSYLAARPSRDLIMAAHQQITHDWWLNAHDRFDLYISDAVLNEIRGGDPDAAARRMSILNGLPVLQLNDDVRRLVHEYDRRLGLTGRARADLPHFAFAVAYQMDYLVTWNCRHIANGEVIRRLLDANAELQRPTPLLVTPEEILSSPEEDES